MPCNTDKIAQIKQLEKFKWLRAYDVQFYVNLYSLTRAGNVRESGLSMKAQC